MHNLTKSDCANSDYLRICGAITTINMSCPRILYPHRTHAAGIGHQLSEYIFFLELSKLYNAAIVVDEFQDIISNHGQSFVFLNKLMGFTPINSLYKKLIPKFREVQSSEFSDVSQCSVVLRPSYGNCPGDCFFDVKTRYAFDHFSPCIRYQSLKYGNWNMRNPFVRKYDNLNIVWHVRIGDLTLHKPGDSFYSIVLENIKPILKKFTNYTHYIIGGGGKTSDCSRIPDEYEFFFRNILGNNTIFGCYTVEESMLHMLHSNVIIGSGSSFPVIGSLLSSKPMFLNHVQKHGFHHAQDYLSDGIWLDIDGSIRFPVELMLARINMLSS